MNGKKLLKLRAVCSVSQMASALDHSRARFYQLQREGIYPPPIYNIRTRRPFFDTRLQQICQEVRETGIGWMGQYVLFYAPRNNITNSSQKGSSARTGRKSGRNSQYQELVETLNCMGLETTSVQVQEAVETLYPEGMKHEDQGVVIREIFRFLKKRLSD